MLDSSAERRLFALEQAQKGIERELGELATTLENITRESLIEEEVAKRLHERATFRVSITTKVIGATFIVVQIVSVIVTLNAHL